MTGEWESPDFTERLEAHVKRLLQSVGITRPPVDAILLARRLGMAVIVDASQQPRGRQTRIAGRPSIFIRPDDRPERRQWSVAHELGETLVHKLFGEESGELSAMDPRMREHAANLAASRILLPSEWFREDAARFSGDLFELKRRYESASHELIAFRLLDLPQPVVITVFDQGKQTRRRGNTPARVPPLDRLEQECWLTVRRFHRTHEIAQDGRRVQGWPIHEPGWQREILQTSYDGWETDDSGWN